MGELINIAVAKLAKEKGFREKTWDYLSTHDDEGEPNLSESCEVIKVDYNDMDGRAYISHPDEELWSRPSKYQLHNWLLKEHQIFVKVEITNVARFYTQIYHMDDKNKHNCLFFKSQNVQSEKFDEHDDALDNGLLAGLRLVGSVAEPNKTRLEKIIAEMEEKRIVGNL